MIYFDENKLKNKIFTILKNNIGKRYTPISIYKEIITDKDYHYHVYEEKNYFDYMFLIILRTFKNYYDIIIKINNFDGISYIQLKNNTNNHVCNKKKKNYKNI